MNKNYISPLEIEKFMRPSQLHPWYHIEKDPEVLSRIKELSMDIFTVVAGVLEDVGSFGGNFHQTIDLFRQAGEFDRFAAMIYYSGLVDSESNSIVYDIACGEGVLGLLIHSYFAKEISKKLVGVACIDVDSNLVSNFDTYSKDLGILQSSNIGFHNNEFGSDSYRRQEISTYWFANRPHRVIENMIQAYDVSKSDKANLPDAMVIHPCSCHSYDLASMHKTIHPDDRSIVSGYSEMARSTMESDYLKSLRSRVAIDAMRCKWIRSKRLGLDARAVCCNGDNFIVVKKK